jgi:hypothetical protein
LCGRLLFQVTARRSSVLPNLKRISINWCFESRAALEQKIININGGVSKRLLARNSSFTLNSSEISDHQVRWYYFRTEWTICHHRLNQERYHFRGCDESSANNGQVGHMSLNRKQP